MSPIPSARQNEDMNTPRFPFQGTILALGLMVAAPVYPAVTNDTTFGNFNGTATISQGGLISENVRDLAVDADGRVVMVGHVDQPPFSALGNNFALALARLTPAGLPDASFSGDGKLYMPTCVPSGDGPGGTQNPRIALQADGKIVVGATCIGAAYGQIVLARFLTDGTLDSSFDGDGILYLPHPTADRGSHFSEFVIQPDGKIVVAGMFGTSPGNLGHGVILRVNAGGSPDTTFATLGTYTAAERTNFQAVELMADGRIVGGGVAVPEGVSSTDVLVTRLTAAGAPDASFGTQGVVVLNIGVLSAPVDPVFPTRDALQAIAVRPDGRIVAGGWSRDSLGQPQHEPLVMQLTAKGALDSEWGQGGFVPLGGVPGEFNVLAIHLLPDGDALIGGIRIPFTHVAASGLGRSNDSVLRNIYGIAMQNGKAITATATDAPSLDFRAMRFNFSAQFDATPDPIGFAHFFVQRLGVPVQSDTVTITGIATSTDVSVVNGEVSIFCTGTFVPAGETRLIQNNTQLCLRHTTSDTSNTTNTTMLTVGGVTANWSTTTGDGSPDGLAFVNQTAVATSATVTSAAVTVTGINMPVQLMISGGEHSVGCTGTYASTNVQIINNQTLCLRHTSSASAGTMTTTTLRAGDVVATFSSTTAAATPPSVGGGSSGGGGGGGGGGAFDWLLLALLATTLIARLRERHRTAQPLGQFVDLSAGRPNFL
jgi:uncharacterized delta-60 repeat protein